MEPFQNPVWSLLGGHWSLLDEETGENFKSVTEKTPGKKT